jgi:hypothetical protein
VSSSNTLTLSDFSVVFGVCFPTAHLGESPPLGVLNGRLVAV